MNGSGQEVRHDVSRTDVLQFIVIWLPLHYLIHAGIAVYFRKDGEND